MKNADTAIAKSQWFNKLLVYVLAAFVAIFATGCYMMPPSSNDEQDFCTAAAVSQIEEVQAEPLITIAPALDLEEFTQPTVSLPTAVPAPTQAPISTAEPTPVLTQAPIPTAEPTSVPTLELTAAPALEGSSQNAYVNAGSLNMRSDPSRDAEIIKEFRRGESIEIIGEDGDWYKVAAYGTVGYMLKKYVGTGSPSRAAEITLSNDSNNSDNSDNSSVQAAAAVQPASSGEVWIPTKGGKKYHTNSGCSNMNGPEHVTIEEAKNRGFTPCKKCCR